MTKANAMNVTRIMKAVARSSERMRKRRGRHGDTQMRRSAGPKKCGPGQTRRLIFNHFQQYSICGEMQESLAVGRFLGHYEPICGPPWPRNRPSQTGYCRRNVDQ